MLTDKYVYCKVCPQGAIGTKWLLGNIANKILRSIGIRPFPLDLESITNYYPS